METDFYQALGVSRTASALEIREAYRRLVRQHHPDANPQNRAESEALMKQILEAYATLCDASKRAHYDNQQKMRVFEKSQQESAHRVYHHPPGGAGNNGTPASLMGKVRVALGESKVGFAAQLGLSEAELSAFETRDSMPQTALQMRTFAQFVERAAQKLDGAQRFSEASDLRHSYERKKTNRNFMK